MSLVMFSNTEDQWDCGTGGTVPRPPYWTRREGLEMNKGLGSLSGARPSEGYEVKVTDVPGDATVKDVTGGEFLLQFFQYSHLPLALQEVSRPFWEMADWIVEHLPRNPERTTALRKLLEAKDCAVRAMVAK